MKALLVTLITCLVVSCNSPFSINLKGYTENKLSLNDAWVKTSSYKYIDRPLTKNYVKSPSQFEKDGGGICTDFAVYMMYLLGPESELIGAEFKDGLHMIIKYKNLYIEPQVYGLTYKIKDFTILEIHDYNSTMKFATWLGIKSISSF